MQSVSEQAAGPIVLDMAAAIVSQQALLSEIDGKIGDGDHGINMAKGFRMAADRLRAGEPFGLTQGLATLGDTLLGDIGGSMGPLYGSCFTEMADALNGADQIDADRFAAMLNAGCAAVQDLGGAKPGDKTLVDVLAPATAAFAAAHQQANPFDVCLAALKHAAAAGHESTRDMVAKLGRASRLGERSRGTLDAGATSCNLLLVTLADGLTQLLHQDQDQQHDPKGVSPKGVSP